MSLHNISGILFCLMLFACTNTETKTLTKNPHPIDFNQRLDSLGIELPVVSAPVANYVNISQARNILYLSGKGPKLPNGEYIKGKLGIDLTEEEGYQAAKQTALNQLAVLQSYLGDLNKVKRVLKVTGMVNASSEFENHPEVINGFSDLMVQVFKDKGKHARAAVGMASLPRNIAVEVELIVEIY